MLNRNLLQLAKPSMISLLLLATCLVLIAISIKQWRDDARLAKQATPAPVTVSTNHVENKATLLTEAHLFGQSLGGNMPISNLGLSVTGIVKSIHGDSHSKAYISIGGNPSKVYRVGDELPYGVTLYAVNPDAIVLANDGRLEQLPLQREKLEFNKPINRGDLS